MTTGWMKPPRSRSWHQVRDGEPSTVCRNYAYHGLGLYAKVPDGQKACKVCANQVRKPRTDPAPLPVAMAPEAQRETEPWEAYYDAQNAPIDTGTILGMTEYEFGAMFQKDAAIEDLEALGLKRLWNDADGDGEATTKGGGIARMVSPPDQRLLQAQADAAGTVMLELQQECIQLRKGLIQLRRELRDVQHDAALWNRRAITLRKILVQQGARVAWTDDGLYVEPTTRGGTNDG